MARPKKRVPDYRLHKATGLAVVTIRSKDYYLGKYKSEESYAEYDRIMAEHLGRVRITPPPNRAARGYKPSLTVGQLMQGYPSAAAFASARVFLHGYFADVKDEQELEQNTVFNAVFRRVFGVLVRENERGCVVVAAAAADDALNELLRKRLVDPVKDNPKQDELLSGHGPICTFSSRIDLAFRVGAVSRKIRKSLHTLRELRNKFAHVSDPVSFKDDDVRQKVEHLLRQDEDALYELWPMIRDALMEASGKQIPEGGKDIVRHMIAVSGHKLTFVVWASLVVGALTGNELNTERLREDAEE